MNIVAIVQARMGSSRLPGKVLKDLEGQTVLERVVRRLQAATLVDKIVVATSNRPADDVIADECNRVSVDYFRGSESDVLDRFYLAAKEFSADPIVRITADCPLIDFELVDETIRALHQGKADYATNALAITYPRGLDVEVFTYDALERAWSCAGEAYQRVHVTPYLYENPTEFHIASIHAEGDFSKYRWTLDTAEDFEMIRKVYRYFGGGDHFGWRDVLQLMDEQPELAEINANIRQRTLREG